MDDLISRQTAIDMLATMQGRCTSKTALIQNSKIWQQIKDLPPAQPERKKGTWIDLGKDRAIRWQCSECGRKDTHIYNYCPDCGADMRGEEE